MGELKKFNVFISRASSEFKETGEALKGLFESRRAKVYMQAAGDSPFDGPEIMDQIHASNLIICLVGRSYGRCLPVKDLPKEARKGDSWTQWEYRYARKAIAADKTKRLIPFIIKQGGDPAEPIQKEFIEEICEAERITFLGKFFQYYEHRGEIVERVRSMLESEKSIIGKMRNAFWFEVKARHCATVIDDWNRLYQATWRETENAAGIMNAVSPPFIESQEFEILQPDEDGSQMRHLHPNAFIAGRDSEAKARAREKAVWRPLTKASETGPGDLHALSRLKLAAALCKPPGVRAALGEVELPRPIRLYLIAGGGVGKTTNMRWLAARLSGLRCTGERPRSGFVKRYGILVTAQELKHKNPHETESILLDRICAQVGVEPGSWHAESVRLGVRRDIEKGRLALLIDGLDHIDLGGVWLLTDIQQSGAKDRWAKCKIVVAGRPQAISKWKDSPGQNNNVVAREWRFIEAMEFTEAEAKAYLGNTKDGTPRYKYVHERLGRLAQVPRVLEYTRTLEKKELASLNTAADVYEKAIRHMVEEAQAGAATRAQAPHAQDEKPVQLRPCDYVLKLLSALAFMSLCRTTSKKILRKAKPAKISPRDGPLPLDKDQKFELAKMMLETPEPSLRECETIEQDLTFLQNFAAIVDLNEEVDGPGTPKGVNFCNRTVEQFLAAHWLAMYASKKHAERMRHHIYFAAADFAVTEGGLSAWLKCEDAPAIFRTDKTYDFNLFLAEMPSSSIRPTKWIEAARYWFDPDLFSGASKASRIWPTEMMFRAWNRMSEFASGSVGDWWDIPYDAIATCTPGEDRDERSPHTGSAANHPTEDAANAAQAVLDTFLNEFSAILEDDQAPERQRVAREMIADDEWISVPGGSFEMGRPESKSVRHGCPTNKVEKYWKNLLQRLQNGEVSPDAAANDATSPEWFSGAQGARIRDYDVKWLRDDVFQPLWNESKAAPGEAERSAAFGTASHKIRVRWHTTDETPAENPQAVAPFDMHRYPMLFKWYWLFVPGHQFVVEEYLRDLERRLRNEAIDHPPPDHPVTYVSWFDAWAFCQWANWPAPDPKASDPASAKLGRWHLRLPHEPEWEYAARGWKGPSGEIEVIPREDDWWWGNKFYNNDEPVEEELSRDEAHGIGGPAKTRAPAEADPNGLGFYDILGNVWEWMANPYDLRDEAELKELEDYSVRYSRFAPRERPRVMVLRAVRGGLWYYLNILATCTNRWRLLPDDYEYRRGFRVVREWRSK